MRDAGAIRPVETEADYNATLAEIAGLMDAGRSSPEGARLNVLVMRVRAYEALHCQILPPDPGDAFRFRIEQEG